MDLYLLKKKIFEILLFFVLAGAGILLIINFKSYDDKESSYKKINEEYLIVLIYMLSIVGISWFINAFNFMDGIDGITSVKVIYLTASLIFLNHFLDFNNSILHYSILGVTFGFLFFNWSPASIFLGDSGSMTLGFILSWFLIYYSHPDQRFLHPVMVIWCIALPIYDLLSVLL